MKITDKAKDAAPYAERLFTNSYVQENLSDASDRLRQAYDRARKRRVNVRRDEKIRKQVREAADSLRAAAEGVRTGREKPKGSFAKKALFVVGLSGAAAGTALALSEDLRNAVFGSEEAQPEPAPSSGSNGAGTETKAKSAA